MFRFPNPSSTLLHFVLVYQAAFDRLHGHVINLDDIVKATVDANLATSSGYVGDEAIARSTRPDRSLDPLFNQLKMYAELFRWLGWLRSTEESASKYTFTLLGEQVVAAGRQWQPLLEESVLGIECPNHVIDVHHQHHIRPFATILKTMLACNHGLSRDEMIVGPLSASTDRATDALRKLAAKVNTLRETPSHIQSALEKLEEDLGIKIDTMRNYTRWPLAVLRDLEWTKKDKEPFMTGNEQFEIHRLTPRGIDRAISLSNAVDLRTDQVDKLTFDQKRAFSRWAHFSMMERSGFDLTPVKKQMNSDRNLVQSVLKLLGIPDSMAVLFSPFQSLSASDATSFFPIHGSSPVKQNVEEKTTGIGVGRGSLNDLFVAPRFVSTQYMESVGLLERVDRLRWDPSAVFDASVREELQKYMRLTSTLDDAAIRFTKSRLNDRQNEFYPLVTSLFRLMGFWSDHSRAGVNYQRRDAYVKLEGLEHPIEIKSPAEELHLSTKSIRQALENKVIQLSRGSFTRWQDSTFVVGYHYPNERGEMWMLINDIYVAFGFRVGVIDLKNLSLLALKSVFEDLSVDEEQLSELKGLYNV